MLDGPQLPNNPVDTLFRPEKIKLLCAVLGPYCHPHHVQSSPYSSRLLTMLTTPEGGAAASTEDDGEASDGNEQELGKMRRVLGCDVATMHARQHS